MEEDGNPAESAKPQLIHDQVKLRMEQLTAEAKRTAEAGKDDSDAKAIYTVRNEGVGSFQMLSGFFFICFVGLT